MYQVDLIKAQIKIGLNDIPVFFLAYNLKGLFISYIQTGAAHPMLSTPPGVSFVYVFCSSHFYIKAFSDTGSIASQQWDLIIHDDPLNHLYFQSHCQAVLNFARIHTISTIHIINFNLFVVQCYQIKAQKMNITDCQQHVSNDYFENLTYFCLPSFLKDTNLRL